MSRLNNKVALITGAARGIGAAIARAFIEQDAIVVLTDIDDDVGQAQTHALGDRALYFHLDVRREEHWARVTAEIESRFGRLDVLVNNAGITGFENGLCAHDPEHASLSDWRAVHETNLDGCFLGCRAAIRAMRPQAKGSIINISSRSGLVGIPGAAAYASSKAAIRNHTKSVALYCAEQGLAIRCNSIHPAAILTPMWEPLLGSGVEREARMREFVKDCPLQRFGAPDEVAALAVLLASDEATYITGSEMNIDGGMLAGASQKPSPPRES
ncbi:glucose 1-dehydrogenase [Undibacterium cyanobacteriorum]|uniref:Glucose 1-dehydrogenase n=1 Tax=Undibacterium cyanobacteriorum TaxID=3073561 RepID=A0ABY9RJW7_9BURK|nr:glucose 1-dehydrogenase [Undibacterium sp. 20NA77.5]WMW81139.1 glucose 1-dehydrogenase [Undibacterium sp. 20NA77.5]